MAFAPENRELSGAGEQLVIDGFVASDAEIQPTELALRLEELNAKLEQIKLELKDIGWNFKDLRSAAPLELLSGYNEIGRTVADLAHYLGRTALGLPTPTEEGDTELLTSTEIEVLSLAGQGFSNAQIAQSLMMGSETVKFHLRKIYKKMGVKNRTEASKKGRKLNGIDTYKVDVGKLERIRLTPRQLEVLELLTQGLSNSEIARSLYLADQTVKFHLTNIYRAMGVRNRTEASRLALDNEIITDGSVLDQLHERLSSSLTLAVESYDETASTIIEIRYRAITLNEIS